jgi:hypothetical protein
VKSIAFNLKAFPGHSDSLVELPFSRKSLVRAVIAAGSRVDEKPGGVAGKAEIASRINMLLSAVNFDGTRLTPTSEYLTAGSTRKAEKSFHVGNALCAHAALQAFGIPWLVDLEEWSKRPEYVPGVEPPQLKGRRADFVGQDVQGKWYVFECKGRAAPPKPGEITMWKQQAMSIGSVGGDKVVHNIVSSAYLHASMEWRLLWVDPPAEGDEDGELAVSPGAFLRSYYQEVLQLLVEEPDFTVATSTGLLTYFPDSDVYVGLHQQVLAVLAGREVQFDAQEDDGYMEFSPESKSRMSELVVIARKRKSPLAKQNVSALLSFGRSWIQRSQGLKNLEDGRVTIFPDGLLIKDGNNGEILPR